jgi:enhancer of polycomb-like protein
MDVDEEDPEEVERTKRQEERWRFDQDDAPPSPTADESVRTLVDEYDPKYVLFAHVFRLFSCSSFFFLGTCGIQ